MEKLYSNERENAMLSPLNGDSPKFVHYVTEEKIFLISFAVLGTIFARKAGLKIYSGFFQPEMFYISNERTNCVPLVMCQSDFKIFLSCTLNMRSSESF